MSRLSRRKNEYLSGNIVSQTKEIDLHIHTSFSDSRSSLEDVVRAIKRKGLRIAAVTDHFSEFQILPKRMNKGELQEYLEVLERFPVIKGVEVDIFGDGTVSISKKNAHLFNIVVGGLHMLNERGFWHDPRPIWNPKKFVEDVRIALVKSMESRLIDVIAHITWLPDAIRAESDNLITDDWTKSVVQSASDYGVAIELSGAWNVPNEDFVKECLRQGVKLSIGSDAHDASKVGEVAYAVEMLKSLDVVNDLIYLPKRIGLKSTVF